MKSSRPISNGLVVVVSIVGSLLLAELVARAVLPAPQLAYVDVSEERVASASETELSLADRPAALYVETPTGRRLRANTRIVIQNHRLGRRRIEFATNSIGYRNPEIGPKEGTRILFLGDSITFADYLREDETFVRIVEARARAIGLPWETINAGVGAISLENELAILLETGLDLDPDVVVVGFYLNDFLESPGVHVRQIPGAVRSSRLATALTMLLSSPAFSPASARRADVEGWLPAFDEHWPAAEGDYRRRPEAFNALIRKHLRDWGGAWSDEAWERIAPVLSELRRVSDEQGFELYVVAFPVAHQVVADYVYDHPQQRLREVVDAAGIPLLDLLPALRVEARRSPTPLFYDHCHHTPEGSRLVAARVFEFLRDRVGGGRRESPSGEADYRWAVERAEGEQP